MMYFVMIKITKWKIIANDLVKLILIFSELVIWRKSEVT
jgi:hypothetical protein